MRTKSRESRMRKSLTPVEHNYVLVFLLADEGKEVLLTRKKSPDWQKGKLNGVGGVIRAQESAMDAVVRTLRTEVGLPKEGLCFGMNLFATVADLGTYDISCYVAHVGSRSVGYYPDGTEDVSWFGYPRVLVRDDLVPPLRILLPLAMDSRRTLDVVKIPRD